MSKPHAIYSSDGAANKRRRIGFPNGWKRLLQPSSRITNRTTTKFSLPIVVSHQLHFALLTESSIASVQCHHVPCSATTFCCIRMGRRNRYWGIRGCALRIYPVETSFLFWMAELLKETQLLENWSMLWPHEAYKAYVCHHRSLHVFTLYGKLEECLLFSPVFIFFCSYASKPYEIQQVNHGLWFVLWFVSLAE
jgi:hypothetical protein